MAILRVPGTRNVRRLASRARAVRDARVASSPVALLGFARDVILLVKDLGTDRRVPLLDRVIAGAALAYLIAPVDLIPETVPVAGQFDDLAVVSFAARRLLTGAGRAVVAERWRGTREGLALLLDMAGVEQ